MKTKHHPCQMHDLCSECLEIVKEVEEPQKIKRMAETRVKPIYQYNAEVIRCIDGDTVILNISTGFKHYYKDSVRLALLNTPELTNPDPVIREQAYAAKAALESFLPPGTKVVLHSAKLDPYGRPIGLIYRNGLESEEANAFMLKNGWIRYQLNRLYEVK